MTYYLLKPCRTATAFISTLKKARRFPLEEAAMRLKSSGFGVTDLKVMLVVAGDPELTFYESGKILVKTDDGRPRRAQSIGYTGPSGFPHRSKRRPHRKAFRDPRHGTGDAAGP